MPEREYEVIGTVEIRTRIKVKAESADEAEEKAMKCEKISANP